MIKKTFVFIILSISVIFLFLFDVMWGSVFIGIEDFLNFVQQKNNDSSINYIILNFRIPKAITSVFVGAGISISGLIMQNLFKNPLADTSILGISSGSSLAVAIYMMAIAVFPALSSSFISSNSQWGIIVAAFIGALSVLLIISAVSLWIKNIIAVLIIGVMIGYISSSIISVISFFSDIQSLRGFMSWSFGSVSSTTWSQLNYLVPMVSTGIIISMFLPKYMNAFYLGDNYVRSMGISVRKIRILMIIVTSIITSSITAFCGPIAFLGIAVPHFARSILSTSDNRILIPANILFGAILMLFCDMVTQIPGKSFILPINSITSIIGAPVVILFIIRKMKRVSI